MSKQMGMDGMYYEPSDFMNRVRAAQERRDNPTPPAETPAEQAATSAAPATPAETPAAPAAPAAPAEQAAEQTPPAEQTTPPADGDGATPPAAE